LCQDLDLFKGQGRAQQNMVQAALWTPAGEGRFQLRGEQAEIAQRRILQQVAGVGVHVAHQHLVLVPANQFADVGQLQATRPRPERQVHHHHDEGLRAFAETYQNCPATLGPRQRMIFNRPGAQAAEHAITVLAEATEIAIELLVPVGEGPELGQVFDLVDVARPDAATIGFLQGDQIEVTQQVADLLQIGGAPGVGQQMLPPPGQVVPITLGTDAHLDIKTE